MGRGAPRRAPTPATPPPPSRARAAPARSAPRAAGPRCGPRRRAGQGGGGTDGLGPVPPPELVEVALELALSDGAELVAQGRLHVAHHLVGGLVAIRRLALHRLADDPRHLRRQGGAGALGRIELRI